MGGGENDEEYKDKSDRIWKITMIIKWKIFLVVCD